MGVGFYKLGCAGEALVTQEAQRAEELEIQLQHPSLHSADIPQITQEYVSLMADPEVRTQIVQYNGKKEEALDYISGSLLFFFLLRFFLFNMLPIKLGR